MSDYHDLARRLTQWCEVVVYSVRGSMPEQEWYDRVQYRRVADSGWIENAIRVIQKCKGGWRVTRRFQQRFSNVHSALYHFEYILRIAKDLRREHYDVVHVHNCPQFLPILKALNPHIKTVLHMHGEWLTRFDHSSIQRWLRNADCVVGSSQFLTDEICEAFPEYATRCTTVFCAGIDVRHFAPGGGKRVNGTRAGRVLFVGRISPEKGLHVLLDAFASVVRRRPSAILEIVGPRNQMSLGDLQDAYDPAPVSLLRRFYDGRPYAAHLEQQLQSLALSDSVTFAGPCPPSELPAHYREADVLVLPTTVTEIFGRVTAEAMAVGLPVVATRVGGLPEVVEDGKTGYLVEPNDPSAIADAVVRLLEDESLRMSMGQAARHRVVERFRREIAAEHLVQVYRGILNTRNAAGGSGRRMGFSQI